MLHTAGIDPIKFGLHSPRIGGTTDAFFRNVPGYLIDMKGRWKNPLTKYRYLRSDEDRFVQLFKPPVY